MWEKEYSMEELKKKDEDRYVDYKTIIKKYR
jgi:hypothetical protein